MNNDNNVQIGIFTFQNAINIGAYLQAIALRDIVKKICEEEKINATIYHPYKLSLIKQRYDILTKHPEKIFFVIQRYKKFIKAQKEFQTCKNQKLDLSIHGSDSIWDVSEVTNGYISEMFGAGVDSNVKISYAASFGRLTKYNLLTEEAIKSLQTFNLLGVRDINSKSILNKLGIDSELNLDPTLLMDIQQDNKPVDAENFVLIYGTFPEYLQKEILDVGKKLEKKIISVGTYNSWCEKSIAVSPREFISYVRYADYVITSMYHGSLLSVLLHKRFVSFFTEARMTKVQYTFEVLGVDGRFIRGGDIYRILTSDIDYCEVENRRKMNINQSWNYLRKAIKKIGNETNRN